MEIGQDALRWNSSIEPAIWDHAIGDSLHGPEFLLGVCYGSGIAVEDCGAVIVAVAIGGEGKNEAVEVSCL
jgi:hypothetical protein